MWLIRSVPGVSSFAQVPLPNIPSELLREVEKMLQPLVEEVKGRLDSTKKVSSGYLQQQFLRFSKIEEQLERFMADAEAERFLLACADVIFCTLSSAGNAVVRDLKWHTVVVDEAAQAPEAETLIALKEGVQRLVLVGDPQQLPATVISHLASSKGFGRSMMARLMALQPETLLLRIQYRMHPAIAAFPSRRFYNGRLIDSGEVQAEGYRQEYHRSALFQPFVFLNVHGAEAAQETSLRNVTEARVVRDLVERLLQHHDVAPRQVALVTPYSAQVRELTRRVRAEWLEQGLTVRSVDGCQGAEQDVVLFSAVRTGEGDIGFLSDVRRLNVALTRAKYCLVIVGHARALGGHPDWEALVRSAWRRGCYHDLERETCAALHARSPCGSGGARDAGAPHVLTRPSTRCNTIVQCVVDEYLRDPQPSARGSADGPWDPRRIRRARGPVRAPGAGALCATLEAATREGPGGWRPRESVSEVAAPGDCVGPPAKEVVPSSCAAAATVSMFPSAVGGSPAAVGGSLEPQTARPSFSWRAKCKAQQPPSAASAHAPADAQRWCTASPDGGHEQWHEADAAVQTIPKAEFGVRYDAGVRADSVQGTLQQQSAMQNDQYGQCFSAACAYPSSDPTANIISPPSLNGIRSMSPWPSNPTSAFGSHPYPNTDPNLGPTPSPGPYSGSSAPAQSQCPGPHVPSPDHIPRFAPTLPGGQAVAADPEAGVLPLGLHEGHAAHAAPLALKQDSPQAVPRQQWSGQQHILQQQEPLLRPPHAADDAPRASAIQLVPSPVGPPQGLAAQQAFVQVQLPPQQPLHVSTAVPVPSQPPQALTPDTPAPMPMQAQLQAPQALTPDTPAPMPMQAQLQAPQALTPDTPAPMPMQAQLQAPQALMPDTPAPMPMQAQLQAPQALMPDTPALMPVQAQLQAQQPLHPNAPNDQTVYSHSPEVVQPHPGVLLPPCQGQAQPLQMPSAMQSAEVSGASLTPQVQSQPEAPPHAGPATIESQPNQHIGQASASYPPSTTEIGPHPPKVPAIEVPGRGSPSLLDLCENPSPRMLEMLRSMEQLQ